MVKKAHYEFTRTSRLVGPAIEVERASERLRTCFRKHSIDRILTDAPLPHAMRLLEGSGAAG